MLTLTKGKDTTRGAPEPPAPRIVLSCSMLSRTAALLGVGLAALTCACSPSATTAVSPSLPLRTLRLYETGVGYFERSGSVGAPTSLPVPAGHLDDALETLVVLGEGGKSRVRGIEFGSSISRGMARALAGLPVEGDEPLGLQQILTGLKGAAVEVRARGNTNTGRIVDVVQATADGVAGKDAAPTEVQGVQGDSKPGHEKITALTLLVLTERGAIVRVPVADVDAVRPLDPGYAARLGSALDALSTRGAQNERMLHVLSGGGPVTLGYVAETPVWRTTYRLVLDGDGHSAVLEGWALLHNDTDEDWRGVHVELANGRPDSFLFPLAAPRYARRQLVTPDDQLATVPQLMGTTVDAIWGDQTGDSFGAGGLGLTGTGEGGGGHGEGIGLGSIGSIGHGSGGGGGSSLVEVGNLASVAPAEGAEAGALFVYTLPDRLDLHAHGSALVPFEQQRVDARSIAWLDSPGSPARSAVRFVNSTPQTLPAGTVAFFGDGGFAGESAVPRLKPGERRFLTYGMDLDVEVSTVESRWAEEPRRLVWDQPSRVLQEHYLRTTDATYSIENRSGHPRDVVVAMALDRNATLTGPDAIDFDTATGRPLAIYSLEARKRVERKTHSVEGLARSTAFPSLTSKRLVEIAAATSLGAADRAAATEAGARLKEAEDDAKAVAKGKADIAEVEKDLDRLREHMKALAGEHPAGGAAANPFATRVLAAEDRLASLRKRLEGVQADAKSKSDAAATALEKLTR